MNTKKSSYYKLFRYALLVVIVVLLLTGLVMVSISSAVYNKIRLDALRSDGSLFIECLKDEYDNNGSIYGPNARQLHERFCDKFGLEIYIYDAEGTCILPESSSGEKMSVSMKETLEKENLLTANTANITASKPMMLYGSMFFFKSGVVSPVKSYALIYSSMDSVNSFTAKIAVFYIAFASIGIYLTYLLLKRRIKKHVAYENDFLRVSEMYAKGDFSEKIRTDLPGNLQDIATCVNALAANVENSEVTSKTFIANVSHELRTPMTTIGGFVDGILDGTIKKTRQTEYLILVSKEIKRLRILISSMLNMTKFESGTLVPNFQRTNMTDLVIQTVFMFEKKIDDKHVEVEGLGSPQLDAVVDADLMQQVIYNLVENAVKFVNDGGTLSFSFEKEGDLCTVGIKNTGEGLKDSEIQQVFDRFYKTDSSRGKDTTGLGLGLSISRKIVHLHHGHIVVKSVYGEYTEFQIQIPEDPTKTKAGKRGSEKKNSDKKGKV